MTNNKGPRVVSSSRPIRERVGLIVDGANTAAAIKTIVAAEDAGVRQIWMAQPPPNGDYTKISRYSPA